jgi:hypothetical protein
MITPHEACVGTAVTARTSARPNAPAAPPDDIHCPKTYITFSMAANPRLAAAP